MKRRYGDPSWNGPESTGAVPTVPASRKSAPRRLVQSPRTQRLPFIELAGVELHAITEQQTIDHIIAELNDGRGGVVVTPNLDYVRRCTKDLQFHAMVSEADLAVADGMPLIWASRIAGTPLPERVAGSNLISSINDAAARHGKRVYFLGGNPGAAEGAVKVLQERHPEIQIAGIHFPPFGFDKNPKLWAEMENAIVEANPDIVFVALGAPKQETTICKLQGLLPKAWWIGVGNSFSFLSGQVQRAPKWMHGLGLEWVHRLIQEPSKLWKRYLVAGVPFAVGLLATSVVRGVPNRLRKLRYGKPDMSWADETAADVRRSAASAAASAAATTEPAKPADPVPTPAFVRAPRTPGKSTDQIFQRLKALILLGGSVRPGPLTAATGRSILDLPLEQGQTILNYWLGQAAEVAKLAGLDRLPVRVMVNKNSGEPTSAAEKHFGNFRVELDASEFRGTAGVLKGVASDYGDDDYILVANACQIMLDPLAAIATALAKQGGDVNLVSHDDGTPSGVQLLACKTVRKISDAGYHDMKEQALPQIASEFDVRVMRRRRPTGLPIRALDDYMQALRLYHRRKKGLPLITDPMAEDWAPVFSIVEPGVKIAGTARVHDAVVLTGSTVEAGATLVRSLVCGDATVRAERTVVDQYVTAAPTGGVTPLPVAAAW